MIVTLKFLLVGTPDGSGTSVGKAYELIQDAARLKLCTPRSEWSYHYTPAYRARAILRGEAVGTIVNLVFGLSKTISALELTQAVVPE